MKLRMGNAGIGAVCGALVVLIWWVVRSDVYPLDRTAGLVLIASLFVAAGWIGTLRSGSFAGGVQVGFVAGLVGALTVPAEYLLFNSYRPDTAWIVFSMATSAAVVLLLAAAGAALTTLPRHSQRVGRGIQGFLDGLSTAP